MRRLRRLILADRAFAAALLLLLALAMRAIVPAGFMPVAADGRVTIAICSGGGPATMAMTRSMPGMAHGDPGPDRHDDADHAPPCNFAGLAAPLLGTDEGGPSPGPIAPVPVRAMPRMTAGFVVASDRLRPPLRGPPPLA